MKRRIVTAAALGVALLASPAHAVRTVGDRPAAIHLSVAWSADVPRADSDSADDDHRTFPFARTGVALVAADYSPASHRPLVGAVAEAAASVPEPATWAMMLVGFAMIAAVVRRKIRASEAAFTEKMRRIAAGEPE